jgi:glutamyl/glutaminyl-tRNA synthetase
MINQNKIADKIKNFLVLYFKYLRSIQKISTVEDAFSKGYAVIKQNSELTFEDAKTMVHQCYDLYIKDITFDVAVFKKMRPEFIKQKNDNNLNSFKLENVTDSMKLRLAPNPNSSPAIGSLRMVCIHKFFTMANNCRVIVRFDDTDPDNKASRLCCYQTLLAACDWAKLPVDYIVSASTRSQVYKNALALLIKKGWVYANTYVTDKTEGLNNSVQQNLSIWNNRSDTQSLAFRFKSTSISPQLSNWVCYRRVINKHTFKSNEFTPTVNFQSTVDDFKEGVTHMLRGLDLESTESRQRELWTALNDCYESSKPFPTVKYWGRLSVPGTISSSSKINKALQSDYSYASNLFLNYSTVHSFRIPFEGLYKYFLESGFSRAEHKVNLKKLRTYCLKSLERPICRPSTSEELTEYPLIFSNETVKLPTILEYCPSMNFTYKVANNYLIYNVYLNNYFVLV